MRTKIIYVYLVIFKIVKNALISLYARSVTKATR